MVTNESINPNKLWCKPRKRLSRALCCVSSPSPPVPLCLYYFQHLSASLVTFFTRGTRSLWPTVTWICTVALRARQIHTDEEKRTKLEPDCCFSNFSDLGADQLFQWEMCTLWIMVLWIPGGWLTGEKHDCSLGNLYRRHYWLQGELIQSLILQVLQQVPVQFTVYPCVLTAGKYTDPCSSVPCTQPFSFCNTPSFLPTMSHFPSTQVLW